MELELWGEGRPACPWTVRWGSRGLWSPHGLEGCVALGVIIRVNS